MKGVWCLGTQTQPPGWLSCPAFPFLGMEGGRLQGQRPLECASTRFLTCKLPSRNYSTCPHPARLPFCNPQPHHFPHWRWVYGRPSLWPRVQGLALLVLCLHYCLESRYLLLHKKKALGSHVPAVPCQYPAQITPKAPGSAHLLELCTDPCVSTVPEGGRVLVQPFLQSDIIRAPTRDTRQPPWMR